MFDWSHVCACACACIRRVCVCADCWVRTCLAKGHDGWGSRELSGGAGGSRKGPPHGITVSLLWAKASSHKHTDTQNVPTAFQLCSDQCRASCPESRGHSWTRDVWEARGVTWTTPSCWALPPYLTAFPPVSSPHQHLQWSLPSGEQLYEPLQLPSAVAELPEWPHTCHNTTGGLAAMRVH